MMNHRLHQKGLSMVELMIGIVLGSLIIIVVLYILAGSRASSQIIEAESRMQDNIQYAVEVLNSTIRQAGYSTNPTDDYNSIIVGKNGSVDILGDIIQGGDGGTDPDYITVFYQGNVDETVVDCLGVKINPDSAPNPSTDMLVVSNTFSINNDGALQCSAQKIINGDVVTGSADTQPLIGGISGNNVAGVNSTVSDLQVLYGLDTDTDGSVNQYKTYDQITTLAERKTIIGVSIQITLQERIGADTLEKTFTSAVYLRNRI